MRLAATSLFFLIGSGAAFAADCAASNVPPDVVIAPDSRSASVFPAGFVVSGGSTDSCSVSVDVPIPDGYYGVYKIDSRGFVALNDGESSTYSVTYDGGTQSAVVDGEYLEDAFYTHYFGTGLGPVASFDAEFGLEVDGDGSSSAELDSIDVLAGFTSWNSQVASVSELSLARTALVTHLGATGELLIGGNQPRERGDSLGAFGALGSHIVGGIGHFNLGGGFILDGGAALFDQSVGGIAGNGALLGLKASYLQPDDGTSFRLIGSAGLRLAPGMNLTFTRHYSDGSDEGATVLADTTGNLFGIEAEAGVLVRPGPTSELVFTAAASRTWLGVEGYEETIGGSNLFPITTDTATGTFDVVKLKAAWTSELAEDLDLTLHGAVGHGFAHDDVVADVAFVGDVSTGGVSEFFAEYGARLGWAYSPATTMSVFALGSTGAESGTHMQAGAGLAIEF
ncbi:MAG: hypothetical protein IPK28_08325 [Devosia sp.]|nr:hypothetical protein [Devosia sp.]